jgi:hypothetical protein
MHMEMLEGQVFTVKIFIIVQFKEIIKDLWEF